VGGDELGSWSPCRVVVVREVVVVYLLVVRARAKKQATRPKDRSRVNHARHF
jgi:hypothetical protein